ncbi:tRNA(Met) cytidine acetyltransferase [Halomonas sp. PA5]|nr:tRNA(Met) cytidine acetyltransferase [Halomonas sp. PA5]
MVQACPAFKCWMSRLAERRWRGLVWLQGEPDEAQHQALALWREREWRMPLWVGAAAPAPLENAAWLPAAKARTRLGSEHELVVFDACSEGSGFDPEAFGALTGTLIAGGVLVLITPCDWGSRPDADYARLAEHPHRWESLPARYLKRLGRTLDEADCVVRWTGTGGLTLPELAPLAHPASDGHDTLDPDCATPDQAQAVARLLRLRRRRPLVLTADRGRGKSAALGIACARWLAQGEREVLVTAPRPSAVETLFQHLQVGCPQGERHGNHFVWQASEREQRYVRFIAPDALADDSGEVSGGLGSLLLVDEAAAIPAALLGQWLKRFPRIAFATTVHGYEGSGRGFALRFRHHLERHAPEWREYRLEQPIRWAADDPLERLTTRLLMLDAEPRLLDSVTPYEPWQVARWKRSELLADELRLKAIFGLLVQAHYRTQPSDLRRLLDGPGITISTLERDTRSWAVSLCVEEGGFNATLAEQVALGERRPRGHLLAQSLAAHAGSRRALMARIRRVMRIAVHDDIRRCGLGRQLIEAELTRARHDGIDLLGASFGAELGLLAFWRQAGFRFVRLGLSREVSSGEHALMAVHPTSDAGSQLTDDLAERFQALLPTLLTFELRHLDPWLALALLSDGETPALDTAQRCDVLDVARGHRELALARPALQRLLLRGLTSGAAHDEDGWLMVALLFQNREMRWLAERLGLTGRREVQQRLREAVSRWLIWSEVQEPPA